MSREREVQGLPPVESSAAVRKAAQAHVEDMARRAISPFEGPAGLPPSKLCSDGAREIGVGIVESGGQAATHHAEDLLAAVLANRPTREVTLSRLWSPRSAPGSWTVVLDGTGDFSLNVSGESSLRLSSLQFVEPAGRPGHEGFRPIAGLPSGDRQTVAAMISGTFSTAAFERSPRRNR